MVIGPAIMLAKNMQAAARPNSLVVCVILRIPSGRILVVGVLRSLRNYGKPTNIRLSIGFMTEVGLCSEPGFEVASVARCSGGMRLGILDRMDRIKQNENQK